MGRTSSEPTSAELSGADLGQAILIAADLGGTNLTMAYLGEADLTDADLSMADLTRTDLTDANLTRADLRWADLSEARVFGTIFANIDLSTVKGIETIKHDGPSTIGIDTIYRSKGKIPAHFLRGAGVPDNFIEYMSSLVGTAL